MANPLTAQELLGLLRTHRLLEPAQLQQLAAKPPAALGDSRKMAGDLVKQGWLTPFQINQIFQGHVAELVLGPYLLLERLGEGGMGQVFKARHTRLERLVSLKIIRKDRLSDREAVQRFQREAKSAARLSHNNVVTIFDSDQAGETYFLAMEYVEGTDLFRLVKQQGKLPVETACSYIRQAALGLQHIHETGLVHRDIKPTNLIVTARGGVVKILDLGLARWNDPADDGMAGLTQTGTIIGTLDYMPPEQAMDSRAADIRADIYSLGCTFYFLLTGQAPFPTGSPVQKIACHAQRMPMPVAQLRPDMPAGLQEVLSKMLAKRPEDRYQTPVEVAWALDPFVSGGDNFNSASTALPRQTTSQSQPAGMSPAPQAPGRDEMSWSVPQSVVDKMEQEMANGPAEGFSFSLPLEAMNPVSPATPPPAASPPPPPPPIAEAPEDDAANWVRIDKTVLAPPLPLPKEPPPPKQEASEPTAPVPPAVSAPTPAAPAPVPSGGGFGRFLGVLFLLACVGAGVYGYLVIWPQWQVKRLIAEGKRHISRNEIDEAIESFTGVLRLDAKNAAAFRERASAFNIKNNYESARKDAGDAISQDPRDAAAFRERGWALAHLNSYDQAYADFAQALLLNPDDATTYSQRGDTYNRQGELDKALADFTLAIKHDPKPARAYHRRGQLQARMGKSADAENDYKKALEVDAAFAVAYCGLGELHLSHSDLKAAQADFDQALKTNPKSAAAIAGLGLIANRQGRWKDALAAFDKAITLDANCALAYRGRSETLMRSSTTRAQAALDAALQAERLDPTMATAFAWHGVASAALGAFGPAMTACEKAIQLAPTLAEPYVCRANVHRRQKEYDKAFADLDKALKLDPKFAQAHSSRGRVYLDQKKFDQAIVEYGAAIGLGLKNPSVLMLRALAFAGNNQLDKAKADFAEALKMDPDDLQIYEFRAAMYRQHHEPGVAMIDYSTIIAKDPGNISAHLNRGVLYEAKREYAKALEDYDAVTRINPKDLRAYFNRGNVYRVQKEWKKVAGRV